jgi:hypothetical protein
VGLTPEEQAHLDAWMREQEGKRDD